MTGWLGGGLVGGLVGIVGGGLVGVCVGGLACVLLCGLFFFFGVGFLLIFFCRVFDSGLGGTFCGVGYVGGLWLEVRSDVV